MDKRSDSSPCKLWQIKGLLSDHALKQKNIIKKYTFSVNYLAT